MKLTKNKLKEIIRAIIAETKAEGYDDPAYRATVKQFKGKKVSKKEFAQALAMHHQSMDEATEKPTKLGISIKAEAFLDTESIKVISITVNGDKVRLSRDITKAMEEAIPYIL